MKFYGNIDVIKDMKLALINPLTSYVLKGDKGLGKATIGRLFSKKLLCISNTKINGACDCKSCRQFDSSNHPDFIPIGVNEGEKVIKVDQIREVIESSYRSPNLSKRKVYFIDDANLLTVEAQNALLKTLEEGFNYITFVFVSHEPLLATINSRSTIFQFKTLSKNIIRETIELEEKYKDLVIAAANGIGIAKELSCDSDFIKESETLFDSLVNIHSLSKQDFLDGLGLLKEKEDTGLSESRFLEELLNVAYHFFFDLFRLKIGDSELTIKTLKKQDIQPYLNLKLKTLDSLVNLTHRALTDLKNNLFTKDELFFLFVSLINTIKEDGLKCQ